MAPRLSAPPPGGPSVCRSCRCPVRPAQSRCYQCALQAECLAGLLPDVVIPVAYAPKGSEHARNLWLYKSGGPGAEAAATGLRALILLFLHDHGACAWRSAAMTRPTHVAVVPSGRGRPGQHPLWSLVAPCLALPRAGLALRGRADQEVRDADPERFSAQHVQDARVVLLDDTWTSGASAVSAAAALKLAGAQRVAVIVLGRHLTTLCARPGRAAAARPAMPFRAWLCAVHEPAVRGGDRVAALASGPDRAGSTLASWRPM
jgi:hypothetical protein